MSSSGAGEFRADVDEGHRVADLERADGGGEAVEEFVGDALVDVHPLVAGADLAAILEARHHGGADGGADVGVLGDDEGRLAAELEAQDLEVGGGLAEDVLAGADGAGERDEAGERVADEGAADAFAGAGEDVDDAGGKAGLLGELGDFEGGGGGALVRFHHDGVAGDERGADLAAHEAGGVVPGGQADDDAVGDALDPDLLVGGVGGDDVAGDAAGLLGGVGEVEGGALDLAAGLGERLALLGDHGAGEAFAVLEDQAGEVAEHLAARGGRQRLPGGLGLVGRDDGAVGVVGGAGGDRGDDGAGGRVLDLDPLLERRNRPTSPPMKLR